MDGKTYIDPIRESEKKGIRPDLPGDKSREKEAKVAAAKTDLKSAESNAASDVNKVDDSITSTRSAEGSPVDGFVNNVTGGKTSQKGKFKGFFKKKGPLVAALTLLLGGGGLLMGVSSLFPFHLVEMFETVYGTSFVARQARAPYLLKYVFNLENDEVRLTTSKKSILGGGYQKFNSKLTNKTDKLAENGIEVIKRGTKLSDLPEDLDIPDGTKLRIQGGESIETSSSGINGLRAVYGDDAAFSDDILIYRNKNGGSPTLISANKYGEMYRNDTDLRNSVNTSMKTWLGRIADWIDATSARFFLRHNLTKSLFGDWSIDALKRQGLDVDEFIGQKSGDTDFKTHSLYDIEVEGEDEEGNITTKLVQQEKKDDNGSIKKSGASSGAETAASIINIGQAATNIACGYAAVSAAATALKYAAAIKNAETYFVAYASEADRVKAGESTGIINELTNSLMAKDENGKTALDDQGMRHTLSQGSAAVNKNDSTTRSMNLEEAFKSTGSTIKTVMACTISKAGLAVVSGVLGVVTLGTFSIGKAAISATIGTTMAIALKVVVEKVLASVTTDYCTEASGVKKGACMNFGGANIFNNNAQYGGGTAASMEKVSAYYDTKLAILEQEAEYERATLSPFDITSSNTFLGSIFSSAIIPLATAMSNGAISAISSTTSIVGNSVASLLPSSYATSKATYLNNAIGDCPNLEALGAVGDAYCNPIIISDTSTHGVDPEDLVVSVSNKGNNFKKNDDGTLKLSDSGTEIIEPNSNLGKYIMYCSERSSQIGVVDYNILNQENEISKGINDTFGDLSSAVNSVIGATPGLGDIQTLLESEFDYANMGWASGANCVARDSGNNSVALSKTVEYTDGDGVKSSDYLGEDLSTSSIQLLSWDDELAYYRQYVEDDRIMQTADDNYSSPVMAFLEQYDINNPLDNSYEGILARFSGLPKATVIALLDYAEYRDFIANYDPSTRYAFGDENLIPERIQLESTTFVAENVIKSPISQEIVYYDLRSRTATTA